MRRISLIAVGLVAIVTASCSQSGSIKPSDVATMQAVLAGATAALATYENTQCAPLLAKGKTCAPSQAVLDAEAAITAANDALAVYASAPTTANQAAVTSALSNVAAKVAAAHN